MTETLSDKILLHGEVTEYSATWKVLKQFIKDLKEEIKDVQVGDWGDILEKIDKLAGDKLI